MIGTANSVMRKGPGRPKSISSEHFETILQLYDSGLGYRSIANHLRDLGISTTFSAVRRFLKGEGAYHKTPEQPMLDDLKTNGEIVA